MLSRSELLHLLGQEKDNAIGLDRLAAQLKSRVGVTPFVGAGLSADFGFPQWTQFLRDLAADSPEAAQALEERIASGHFEEAAQEIMADIGRRSFQNQIDREFGDWRFEGRQFSGAVLFVPHLSSGPVVTTNFDHVMERVFAQEGFPFEHVVWAQNIGIALKAFRRDLAILVKIHGDVADSAHLILTLDEYQQHYGGTDLDKIDRALPLPKLLEQLTVARPFLFLGCSLTEDRTVSILLGVARDNRDTEHFAVVERPKEDQEWQERRRHLSKLEITPIWFPPGRFDLIQEILEYLTNEIPPALRRAGRKEIRTNLPRRDVSSFVGRQQEIEEIVKRLGEKQLVTLAGPGGCGKTRLMLQVARRVQAEFPDGVWLVELASIRDGSLVPQTVARALGLQEQQKHPPTDILAKHLSTQTALLILDNCEHLLQACADLIREILQAGAGVKILTTTRTVLRLPGEAVHKVSPLMLAPSGAALKALGESEAVQLFVERGQAQTDGFRLTENNASAISEICHRLDGIPLALELAAAWLDTISVEQIARELDQTFRLLTKGPRDALPHQETLRATMEWSYQLLTTSQRSLLRALAVFKGGWTLPAAGAICLDCGDDELAAAGGLRDLLQQSLVQFNAESAAPRYHLLETVRQYARERLEEAGERQLARQRHRDWYLRFAEAREKILREGGDQNQTLQEMELEHDNLRAALDWSIDEPDPDSALRLGAALWRFWENRGFLSEGRQELTRVLHFAESPTNMAALGQVCSGAGLLAYRQGDLQEAQEFFARALEIEQRRGDVKGIANCLSDLGISSQSRGLLNEALEYDEQYIELARKNNLQRDISVGLFNKGHVLMELGQLEAARTSLEESRVGFEAERNLSDSAYPITALGWVAIFEKDPAEAETLFRTSFERREQLKHKRGMADSAHGLGRAALLRDDLEEAHSRLQESLVMAREVGADKAMAQILESLAVFAVRRKEMPRALTLSFAAAAMRARHHTPRPPIFAAEQDRCIAEAKSALTTAEADRAIDLGQTMDTAQALAAATP
jgi:predicted ATPase